MASGHGTALTGRTHGCTDQACDVKILLANPEPSTHGPKATFENVRYSAAVGATAYMPTVVAAASFLGLSAPVLLLQPLQCRRIWIDRLEPNRRAAGLVS